MAAAAMHVARGKGLLVPEDLSIIGFDDSPIASHIWPPLTTVRWPIREMASVAAHKLIDSVDADKLPSRLPSTLIRRSSVAPPRMK